VSEDGRYANMRVIISGPRDLFQAQAKFVFSNVIQVLADGPKVVLLGGRRGCETVAFRAAAMAKRSDPKLRSFHLEVVLPAWLAVAPDEFKRVLKASHLLVAHDAGEVMDPAALKVLVTELRLDPSHPSGHRVRDGVLLGRAGFSAVEAVLIYFRDPGRRDADPFVEYARAEKMRVVEIPLPVEQPATLPAMSGKPQRKPEEP
jgi:hypothetical protein